MTSVVSASIIEYARVYVYEKQEWVNELFSDKGRLLIHNTFFEIFGCLLLGEARSVLNWLTFLQDQIG